MRRRDLITLIGGVAVGWPLSTRAQQPSGLRRIGLLMAWREDDMEVQAWLRVFHDELEKLGWIEDRNVKFEYRWVGNDTGLMLAAARDIVAAKPDLIISSGSPTTAILLGQTRTIPIVFVNLVDPVGQGFVASLSRPGGNATGLVNLEPSMAGKWVELIKEVVPRVARIAVPFNPASTPYADSYLKYFKSAAQALGVEMVASPVADLAELESFVAVEAREPNTGLVPVPSGFMRGHLIAPAIARSDLPAVSFDREFPKDGGLMSYGNDISDNYRKAAVFVDRILKGEKPSELPVQMPVKFELIVNLKVAHRLGLTVPQTLLVAADEVIE